MKVRQIILLLIFMFLSPVAVRAADSPAGIWSGDISGPGNHIVVRIAGDSGRFTATTDSIYQHLFALPTEISVDDGGNVSIKIDELSPFTFTGKQSGDTITGTWSEDTHTGNMSLTRLGLTPAADPNAPSPHLNGTWTGTCNGPLTLHYALHVSGSTPFYRATGDSPDLNGSGFRAIAKLDSQDNVFFSIALPTPFSFTGYYNGDTIVGTWSQAGGMGEMTFARQPSR